MHYLHIWVETFDQTESMEKEQENSFDFTSSTLMSDLTAVKLFHKTGTLLKFDI